MSRIGASLPLVQSSPVAPMSRAGRIWCTCRVTPSNLKFALQESIPQLPRSAGIRSSLQPFRHGRFPAHFRHAIRGYLLFACAEPNLAVQAPAASRSIRLSPIPRRCRPGYPAGNLLQG